MKLKTLTSSLAMTIALTASASTQAPLSGVLAGQPDKPIPQTPEAWLNRMTDFTQNLSAFRDPRVFIPWFHNVTEPAFYTAALYGMQDPVGWLNMFNSMLNPNAYRNWAQFADPAITLRWIAAAADPNFYTALTTVLTDPGKAMRWTLWPADPKLWGAFLNLLNPGMYMKWMLAPLDPRALNLMVNAMNPATYMAWMGAIMDPRTYGPAWANLLSYQPPLPTAQPNPWTVPQTPGSGNPFDLSAFFGQFTLPVPPVPAAPSAPAPAAAAEPPKAAAEAPKTAEPVKPAQPAPMTKVPEPVKPAEAPKAPEAAKPAEPAKVAEPGKVAEAAKPTAPKPVEPAKPAEVAKP
ncbi:MAG: hypothetical protein RMK60_11435, partial [Burkholderiales bacterium]|nr:hypothetical protein [Burkholderiales bacterium]